MFIFSKLAPLRRPGVGGSFTYGVIFSLGTSTAPLLLLLSVAAATANPFYGFLLALFLGLEGDCLSYCKSVRWCSYKICSTNMAKKKHTNC